jgi:membrane protease YdiL (CAAX protease family)
MFTFPFGPRPVRLVIALVAALFAMSLGQLGVELLQDYLQPLSLFRHMDSILYMEIFALIGYVVGFAAAGATLWMFTERGQSFTDAIGLRLSDLKERKWKLFGTGFLCFVGVVVITQVVYSLLPLPAPQSPAGDEAKVLSGTSFGLFVFTACILAPLFEETVFRGLLQNMLRGVLRGTGTKALWLRDFVAVVVTAAIFAAAHGTPTGFPVLFISGLMMGIAYWRTGSLWASISVHFLNNLVATLALAYGG